METPLPDSSPGPLAQPGSAEQPAPPPPPDESEFIRREVQYLVDCLGVRARVVVRSTAGGYVADIRSRRAPGVLVGRSGAMLDAIGHLVRLMLIRRFPDAPPVVVDAGGYRHQRTVALRSKAVAISRIVIETGREMSLEPLTPEELAEVQDELKAIPQVRYRVVGDGPRRDVVIAPSRT